MPDSGIGLEYLHFSETSTGVVAVSTVISERGDRRSACMYRVECDWDWCTRQIQIEGMDGSSLRLSADGHGNWYGSNAAPIPELKGCIDIDISVTPFTNTLPIRRLGLHDGEHREIRVVYIRIPSLEVTVAAQVYTCLTRGSVYRYSNIPPNFMANLEVDSDGLVVDYPGLFRRVG